jgi:hypothetical protein
MPPIRTSSDLHRMIDSFDAEELDLQIEPEALAQARRSLEESGLLLLGEIHGIRQNPLVIRALMRALGLGRLALEWPVELTAPLNAFLTNGTLADRPLWWIGDGRISAGHLAVLAAPGRPAVTLFDAMSYVGLGRSGRDAAMAERILAIPGPVLVAAGNAQTSPTKTELGTPMGAHLAAARTGVRAVQIRYGTGVFYNGKPRHIRQNVTQLASVPAMCLREGELVIDLPEFDEATVPHRRLPPLGLLPALVKGCSWPPGAPP